MSRSHWITLFAILFFLMLFLNKKVRITNVLCEQIKVFSDYRTKHISPWDICCFILFPIALSFILIFALKVVIPEGLAEILATVFSLVFTILFGFSAILVGRMEDGNKIERQIIKETFVSIITATILSLFATIFSIAALIVKTIIATSIIWCIILSLSFMIIMLLLLITKRTFVIVHDEQ